MQSYSTKQELKGVEGYVQVGSLLLPLGIAQRRIYAGPYVKRPKSMVGVKLAPEVKGEFDFLMPIADFDIPHNPIILDSTIIQVLNLLAKHRDVYVGCRGGMGRTGLFLSLLAKTVGVRNPIRYVRDNYCPEAVETSAQAQFVYAYHSPFTFWQKLGLYWQAARHGLVEH